MPIGRVKPVYVQPPLQAKVPSGIIWRLRKCAYGLTDAPRWWYQSVYALIERLGYERVEEDHGLFLCYKDGVLIFALAVHVDDFRYGGTAAEVARFERELTAAFDVGPVAVGDLTLTGLRIRTTTDEAPGISIAVDQDHYLTTIDDVPMSKERRDTKSAAVNTGELTLYRRAVGALLWASGQTQPFMSAASSLLARRFHQAVVNDLTDVNTVIAAAKASAGLPLVFSAVPTTRRLVLFTDASSISLASATAQTGYLIFLAHDDGNRGALAADTKLVLLASGSHRQRRVTHSSFAAETYALLDGMRAAVEVACQLTRMTDGPDAPLLPIDAVVDCLSLFNTMSATNLIEPKEVSAGVAALRDMYVSDCMSSITWTSAGGQLADCLTKRSSSLALRQVLRTGCYGLTLQGVMTKTHETDRLDLDQQHHLFSQRRLSLVGRIGWLPTYLLRTCVPWCVMIKG